MDFKKLINDYKNCSCGVNHECDIKDIVIESGAVNKVGSILTKNNFPKNILLLADKNTIKASNGIKQSLKGFSITEYIYDDIRVAKMEDVLRVEKFLDSGIEGVLAVGTGSVHDPARLACANKNKPLCLFATAPSMDGFASYSAPIVNGNFKITYPAKCPEIIIADTKILAQSPTELKSAGFGDMVSKYIALIDWKVSALLTNESYCERVANLTRYAVDYVMSIADKVTSSDEESAKAVFEGLLLTGIAMSFTKTSRPGSGCEHIMAHYIECKELLENKIPDYHGEDVGVTTLLMLKFYKSLLKLDKISVHKEVNDWEKIKKVYGGLSEDMIKLNTPDTITDGIDIKKVEQSFDKIKEIIASVPSYEEVYEKMKIAGCKLTYQDINKEREFIKEAFIYHPYMRRRLSLRRIMNMAIDIDADKIV